mmetsp:Transcript_34173/g.77976  ORF Transcript_34173/g.77976 Transcript_34173/m.77976 type:complete len:160 (-) Transcript_34173:206-685(-)
MGEGEPEDAKLQEPGDDSSSSSSSDDEPPKDNAAGLSKALNDYIQRQLSRTASQQSCVSETRLKRKRSKSCVTSQDGGDRDGKIEPKEKKKKKKKDTAEVELEKRKLQRERRTKQREEEASKKRDELEELPMSVESLPAEKAHRLMQRERRRGRVISLD